MWKWYSFTSCARASAGSDVGRCIIMWGDDGDGSWWRRWGGFEVERRRKREEEENGAFCGDLASTRSWRDTSRCVRPSALPSSRAGLPIPRPPSHTPTLSQNGNVPQPTSTQQLTDASSPSPQARNEEKSMSMLFRFREAQASELGLSGRSDRRPRVASSCKDLRQCERWRGEILRDISRKVSKIQDCESSSLRAREGKGRREC